MATSSHSASNQTFAVYVGNLSFNTTERDFEAFFQTKCGNVRRVRIVYDKNTGQSRGFGFVNFDTMDSFNAALALHGSRLDGRELRISPSETNPSTSSGNRSNITTNIPRNTAISMATEVNNQPKTQVVHCKKSKYDVYIGRPSDWGNPFVIGKDGDRDDVIRKYRNWIMRQPDLLARAKKELRGQRIACWCKPEACHGDILAELADTD